MDVEQARDACAIGFGCAFIIGGWEAAKSRRLLDAAFDGGVRHFDTAPPYGMGLSEDLLGQVFKNRRAQVSIATKAGIARPSYRPAKLAAHAAYQYIKPWLHRKAPRMPPALPAASVSMANLDPDFVEASLQASLRRLQTDYVDLFLLHEAQADALSDELARRLENWQRAGTCVRLGIASSPAQAEQAARRYPGLFDVFQYDWNLLERPAPVLLDNALRITHRALLHALDLLHRRLMANAAEARHLSQICGYDLQDRARLADIMLIASLAANPASLSLVSTRNPRRAARLGDLTHNHRLRQGAYLLLDTLARIQ